jgi:hypothetical protein
VKNKRKQLLALIAAAVQAAGAQVPLEHGQAAGGEPYLAGGVGQEEIAAMRLARSGFSLSVRTAARGTGAFLADVRLRISDVQGHVLFDRDLAGPWLLIGLRPGRYTLEASRGSDAQRKTVEVPAAGVRELMFYFDRTGETPDPASDPTEHPPASR